MKKILNLRNLFTILIGIFLLAIPINADSLERDYQYESGFAIYKYDYDEYDDDSEAWVDDLNTSRKNNDGSIKEVEDLSTLKKGDYIAISPTLKYIGSGSPAGVSFAMYFYYDSDVLEIAKGDISPTTVFNAKVVKRGGIFDDDSSWVKRGFNVATVGEVTVTFDEETYSSPFSSTTGGSFAYAFFKLKEDVADKPIKLWWLTEEMATAPGFQGNKSLYTVASTKDSKYVYIKTIDMIPEEKKSSDTTLSNISIDDTNSNNYIDYTQDGDLNPGDKTFKAVVSPGIDSVKVSITPKHTAAKVARKDLTTMSNIARNVMMLALSLDNTLEDSISLVTGENTFTYTVTAEDETTEDYIVKILRLSDDATLSDLSIDEGTLDPVFSSSSGTSYSVTVPAGTSNITINATATHENADISGNGSQLLTSDSETKTVTVKAENCKDDYNTVPENVCSQQNYTINVTREAASNNAYLQNLTVSEGTLIDNTTSSPGFDQDHIDYKVEVGNSVENIIITATADDPSAKVEIKKGGDTITSGVSTPLAVGDNDYVIKVTAVDTTTTKEYKLKIIRQSNEKGLATLNVTHDSYTYKLNPEFNPNESVKEFNTIVPANINDVNINVTTKDTNASVQKGDGNQPLTGDSTRLEFTILAQDGTTEVYAITVKRLKDIATLENIELSDISGSFDSGTATYTAENVPYKTKSTNITVTKTDSDASVSNDGEWTFANSGAIDNQRTVVVNAENCKAEYLDGSVPGNTCTSKNYTVIVKRLSPSTDATLSDLTANPGNLDPGFNSSDTSYTVTVPYATNSITLNATKNDENASVEIKKDGSTVNNGDSTSIDVGDNNFVITVTAENGSTTKVYNVKVVRQSNDNTLSNLVITSTPNGTMNPLTFNKDTHSYEYIYNESVTSVRIVATSTHAKAKVQIGEESVSEHTATSTTINPNVTGSVVIKVVPEDATEPVGQYTITFVREQSSVNTLKKLEVKNGETSYPFTPPFNAISSRREYLVVIPYEIDEVDIVAEATSEAARVDGAEKNISVDFEDVVKTITVHPETGSDATYTLTIRRTKSDEARLSKLEVNGSPVVDFDQDTYFYDLGEVDSKTSSLQITYVPVEPHADAVISGNTLVEGENTITITVTPQSGDVSKVKEYKLKVVQTSDDATLSSLTITDNSSTSQGKLDPSFTSGNTEYTYTYPKDATTAHITAISDHNAVITNDGDVTPLSDGLVHTVSVVSQEGTSNPYKITFKKELDSDSTLKSLSVMGDKEYITGFSASTIKYTFSVPSTLDKVTVTALANSEFAKGVVISNANPSGEVTLTSGKNTITVTVTAEDDSTTVYTIEIEKEINQSATLTELKVKNGENVLDFDRPFVSTTADYKVEVGYAIDNVTIEATATAGATIRSEDLGNKPVSVGDNTFTVHVTAEDNITFGTYTVVVHRKSNDSSLSDLSSNGVGTLTNDGGNTYTLKVSDKISRVTLTPSLNHNKASVVNPTNLIDINLNSLVDNKITFEIKAEDTDDAYKTTYTVNVVKLSSDTSLSEVTLRHVGNNQTSAAEPINPGSDGVTYRVTVPYGTEQVIIDAKLNDIKSVIDKVMPLTHNLSDGNTITFKVTAEDESEKTYTVIITVDQDSNVDLVDDDINSAITVFGKKAIWNEEQKYFEVTVDSENINLTESDVVVRTSDNRATVTKSGNMELVASPTVNNYTVTVRAANGTTTKPYLIKITRPASTDTSLKEVTSSVGEVTMKDGQYVITLPVGTESFDVGATPNFVKASVTSGTGAKTVASLTNNEFEIEVTSEANTKETHKVKVEVLGITNDTDDEGNERAGLSVDGYTLNPAFDPATKSYRLDRDVEAEVSDLTVRVHVTGDVKVTYELDNNGESNNNVVDVSGKTGSGVIKVKITSNLSGKEIIYTINFNKLEKTGISALSVDNHSFEENFDENTYNYTIAEDIDVDENNLKVNVTTIGNVRVDYQLNSDASSSSNIIDISNVVGTNVIKVIVTPNNGSAPKIYTITFKKLSGETEKITSSTHNVDDMYVWNDREQIDLNTYITEFDNDSSSLYVYESDGYTEVTSGNVGTGMIIKLIKDGKVLDQKTIMLLGDTNGDGRITINDASKIANHYLKTASLEGVYLIVADTNDDEKITINDASKVANHYLKLFSLFE